MDIIEATEGKTTFLVPVEDCREQFPPGTAPSFSTAAWRLNRDATILLLSGTQTPLIMSIPWVQPVSGAPGGKRNRDPGYHQ